VDDGIEGTKRIDLFGHVAGLSNTREIANDDCIRSGNSGQRFPSSLLVASVQNYFMPLLNEELGSHSAKPVGRTGDEYACHYFFASLLKVQTHLDQNLGIVFVPGEQSKLLTLNIRHRCRHHHRPPPCGRLHLPLLLHRQALAEREHQSPTALLALRNT
jgi:hypothetical protein